MIRLLTCVVALLGASVLIAGQVEENLPSGGPFVNGGMFPAGGDTNLFYWADILVSGGDGRLAFKAEGNCELPDPTFEVMEDDTNRVLLRVGRTYNVTSDQKIVVVGSSDTNRLKVVVLNDGSVRLSMPFAEAKRVHSCDWDGKDAWKPGSRDKVYWVCGWHHCRHWAEPEVRDPKTLSDEERVLSERAYDAALFLAADESCPTNGAVAYEALETAARLGHGRAQFVLAVLWDFGCLEYPIKYGAPTFCDLPRIGRQTRFNSDHHGCQARVNRMGSARTAETPLADGDIARKALFWYRCAYENGVQEAVPFICYLEKRLKYFRCKWIDEGDALDSARMLTRRHAGYKDVTLAREILSQAADNGYGMAKLALALAEERSAEPNTHGDLARALNTFWSQDGITGLPIQPHGYVTNDEWVARIEGLYRGAVESGEKHAGVELDRFTNMVQNVRRQIRFGKERMIHEKELEERRARREMARRPLVHNVKPGKVIGLAGYELGKIYRPPEKGCVTYYGDTVHEYTPQQKLDEPICGMDRLFMRLTPTTHRLFSIRANRGDIKSREELRKEGEVVRERLGELLGGEVKPFHFEVPDSPYWPAHRRGSWSGFMPEVFAVDESLWPTSKNIFAVSETKFGKARLEIRLDVIDHDEFTLLLSLVDESVEKAAESEFDEAFRAKHEGKSWNEWTDPRGRKGAVQL